MKEERAQIRDLAGLRARINSLRAEEALTIGRLAGNRDAILSVLKNPLPYLIEKITRKAFSSETGRFILRSLLKSGAGFVFNKAAGEGARGLFSRIAAFFTRNKR